jgi:transcriptional regulator with XRE-family HTH domain
MTNTDAVTSEQIRAGRALLRWEQKELAERAGVPVQTLKRLEGIVGPVRGTYENVSRVRRTLEAAGIEFLDGEGVRLRSSAPAEQAARGGGPDRGA